MKYALCEDPRTHRFAIVPLVSRSGDDEAAPIPATARWFNSREEAIAALPDLLSGDEDPAEFGNQETSIGGDRPH